MDETLSYPNEDLQTVATTQGKKLDEVWQAHIIHLNQQILQPTSSLSGQGGQAFHQHMITWNQNLEKYYQAFSTFTGLLKSGGSQMDMLDKNLRQLFEAEAPS